MKPLDLFVLIFILPLICLFLYRLIGATDHNRLFYVSFFLFLVLFFHRGALLLVAFSLGYFVTVRIFYVLQGVKHGRALLRHLIGLLLILVGVMAVIILRTDGDAHPDLFGLFSLFNIFFEPIIGQSIYAATSGYDVASGAGSRINLFEMVRAIPLFLLAPILLLCFASFTYARAHGLSERAQGISDYLLPIALTCLLVLIVCLSGFPFIHRYSWFLVLIIFKIFWLLYINSDQLFHQESHVINRQFLSTMLLSVIAGCGVLFLFTHPSTIGYLRLYLPVLLSLFLVTIGLCSFSYLNKFLKLISFLVIGLFSNVMVELLFMSQKYENYRPNEQTILSHIQPSHFNIDAVIGRTESNDVALANLETMSFMTARYGLLPTISFSNIGTLSAERTTQLSRSLREVAAATSDTMICLIIYDITDSNSASSANFIRSFRENRYLGGSRALQSLQFNNALLPQFDPDPYDFTDTIEMQSKKQNRSLAKEKLAQSGIETAMIKDYKKQVKTENKVFNYWIILTASDLREDQHQPNKSYIPEFEPINADEMLQKGWQKVGDWGVIKRVSC